MALGERDLDELGRRLSAEDRDLLIRELRLAHNLLRRILRAVAPSTEDARELLAAVKDATTYLGLPPPLPEERKTRRVPTSTRRTWIKTIVEKVRPPKDPKP